jgi:hypothetical protein
VLRLENYLAESEKKKPTIITLPSLDDEEGETNEQLGI